MSLQGMHEFMSHLGGRFFGGRGHCFMQSMFCYTEDILKIAHCRQDYRLSVLLEKYRWI